MKSQGRQMITPRAAVCSCTMMRWRHFTAETSPPGFSRFFSVGA